MEGFSSQIMTSVLKPVWVVGFEPTLRVLFKTIIRNNKEHVNTEMGKTFIA